MRARNLKPGFFKNEQLADMSPLTRLFFAGLWCAADREGRLENRPKRLKAEILPFDNVPVSKMLSQLSAGPDPFIDLYDVNGLSYIQIRNFPRHQNPHVREPKSTIPAQCSPGARTVPEQGQTGTSTSPARRIPDSGFPLPSSSGKGGEHRAGTGPDEDDEPPTNGNGTHPEPDPWPAIRAALLPLASLDSRRLLETIRSHGIIGGVLQLRSPYLDAIRLVLDNAAVRDAIREARPGIPWEAHVAQEVTP